MFKKLLNKKLLKNEKGLTLIELLAVIVILAIVAAIAIPAIGNIIDNSRVKAAKADAANVMNAANIYFTEHATETTFTESKMTGYITDLGSIDTFTVKKATEGKAAIGEAEETKGKAATVETKGKVSSKTYKIEASTLKELEIDKGDTATDKFTWVTE